MEALAFLFIVAAVLVSLILMTGSGLWWVPVPFIGLGFFLIMPFLGLLVLLSPFLLIFLIAKTVMPRLMSSFSRPPLPPRQAAAPPPPKRQEAPPPPMPRDIVGSLIAEGEAKVDAMRTAARQIPKSGVRVRTLEICAIADRVLAILPETGNEQLARDVLARYLHPAETIISRYARLASRGVTSADEALGRVEEEDLPLLERKLSDLYDRLHRNDLIDLEVAREMLSFDFATAPR